MEAIEGKQQVQVTRKFAEAFALVHAAFRTPAAEIEEAKAAARARIVAAEDSYYESAAMIRAGWNPLTEQASAFRARRAA